MTRLTAALVSACRYCKDLTHSQEARFFLDIQMQNIVRILMELLDMGESNAPERVAIKTCLGSALEVVSYDLAEASMTADVSRSLQVLLDIFDEVNGELPGQRDLITKFQESDGFRHLGWYLSKLRTTSGFPPFDAISTIVKVVTEINAKDHIEASTITDEIMFHLLSVDEASLMHVCDDAIDMCRLIQKTCTKFSKTNPSILYLYFDLYRGFILKLIKSPYASLRIIGWAEIASDRIAGTCIKNRPPPRAFVVREEARYDSVNGLYEIDPETISKDGWPKHARMTSYTKTPCSKFEETRGKRDKIRLTGNDFGRVSGIRVEFHRLVEDRWEVFHQLSTDSPSVCAVGMFRPANGKYSSLEHDLVVWIIEHDILEMIGRDIGSAGDLNKQSINAGRMVFKAIGNILQFILDRMPSASAAENSIVNADVEAALDIVQPIMEYYMMSCSKSAWRIVTVDHIVLVFDTLKNIHERACICNPQCLSDYHAFHRLWVTRLLVSESTGVRKLGKSELLRIEESFPAQVCIVEGADLESINGKYCLKMPNDYTKEGCDDCDTPLTMSLWQHESGRVYWYISRPDMGDDPHPKNNTYYFRCRASESSAPPRKGWVDCEHYENVDLTVTPVGLTIPRDVDSDIRLFRLLQEFLYAAALSTNLHGERVSYDTQNRIHIKEMLSFCLESFMPDETIEVFVCYTVAMLVELYQFTDRSRYASDYQKFARSVILKLITLSSNVLRDVGWLLLQKICEECESNRPSPQLYIVEVDNQEMMSGSYTIDPVCLTNEGWVTNETYVVYTKHSNIDGNEEEHGFRLIQKVENGEKVFSIFNAEGSLCCIDEEITYTTAGLAVPPDQEFKIPECELAKWAIKNGIVETFYQDDTPSEVAQKGMIKLVELLTNGYWCSLPQNTTVCNKTDTDPHHITDMDVETETSDDTVSGSRIVQKDDGTSIRKSYRKRKANVT